MIKTICANLSHLPSTNNINDTALVTVYYHGTPQGDPLNWGGFYFDNGYAYNLGVGFGAKQLAQNRNVLEPGQPGSAVRTVIGDQPAHHHGCAVPQRKLRLELA